jgi:hypothetical protein
MGQLIVLSRPYGAEREGRLDHLELGIQDRAGQESRGQRGAETHIEHFDPLAVLRLRNRCDPPQRKL